MLQLLLLAIFLISARLSLYLFACESIWMGVFLRRMFPNANWTVRERLQIRFVAVLFGIGMLLFAVNVQSSQITQSDAGFLAGCSSPFLVAGLIAVARTTLIEPRCAAQRQQRRRELAALGEQTNSTAHEN